MFKKIDEKYSRILLNSRLKFIALIPLVVLVVLQMLVCHLNATDILSFFSVMFFNVIIVGLAITSLLSFSLTRIEYYIYSAVIGVAYVIALYFVVYSLGLSEFLVYFTTSFSILAIFVLYRNKEVIREYKKDKISRTLFCMLTIVVILIMMLGNSFVNLEPQYLESQVYHPDNLWNIGNITMAYNSYPLQDMRIMGLDFYYHFFTQIFLSVIKSLTGINSFSLFFHYYPFVIAPLIVGGFMMFARRFLNSNIGLTLAFLTFIFAYRSAVDTLFFPYNGPLSYVFLFLSASFFLRSISSIKKKIIDKNTILSAVMLIFAVGSKGPYAAVFLVGYGVALFVTYFTEKNFLATTVRGIIILASFLVPYIYLFTSIHGPGTELLIIPGFSAESLWGAGWDTIVTSLSSLGIYNGAAMLLAIFAYAIIMFAVVTLPIFMIKRLVLGTERKVKYFFAYGVLVVGLALSAIIAQESNSNLYFYYAAVPVGAVILFRYIEQNLSKRVHLKDIKMTVFVVLSSLLIFFSFSDVASYAIVNFKTGIENAAYSVTQYFSEDTDNKLSSEFTDFEYEACIYIRDNTPENSLILSDRHEVIDIPNFYYYSAFTERQFLIEGYKYVASKEFGYEDFINSNYKLNEAVFAGDAVALENVSLMGYDEVYIIVDESSDEGISDLKDGLLLVYDNPQISVYQVEV